MSVNGDLRYSNAQRSKPKSKHSIRLLFRYPQLLRVAALAYVTFSMIYFGWYYLRTAFGWNDVPSQVESILSRQFETHNISPLSNMTASYRFSKMHSKIPTHITERIEPFFIAAEKAADTTAVTAGLFFNELNINDLVSISQRWDGPISAVLHLQDTSPGLEPTIAKFMELRELYPLIKENVDLHLVISPPHTKRPPGSQSGLPKSSNFHLNTMRFFARTDYVALLDPLAFPSKNLHSTILNNWRYLLDKNDVLVIPTFLFTDSGPSPQQDTWPDTKEEMISAVERGDMALWDKSWEWNKGPSCWDLWRRTKSAAEAAIAEGRTNDRDVIGSNSQHVYKVDEYELHFTGNVVFRRNSQPWCTERFMENKAACIYQMYLSGAELWVIPDAFLISTEKDLPPPISDKFERSIATRLYTKFHQEICMRYARQFYHSGELDSRRAKHLKFLCARVLHSWGKGIVTV